MISFLNRLAVFSFSVLLLFLPEISFSSELNDPCRHIKSEKAEMAKNGYPHWHLQCKPVVISLTWNMVDTFKRHDNYGTDRAKYVIEDSYQGFLYLVYDSKLKGKKQLKNFALVGPHPPGAAKLSSSLKSIEASFLGCKFNGCKRFTTNRKMDFTFERQNPSFRFDWDNYMGAERDNWSLAMVSSCPYPSPVLTLPKPYAPDFEVLKSFYPSYVASGGKFLETLKPEELKGSPKGKEKLLSGEYKDLLKSEGGHISPQDIKLLLKQGYLIKEFKLHEKLPLHSDQVSEYSGLISVRIDLGYKKPALLLVSPDKGFEAEKDCKRITPQTKTYILTNSGHEALEFQVRKKEAWIGLSLSKGTLDPGASTRVTVTLNWPSEDKKKCAFDDKIAFVNLTNHKGDASRKVKLSEVQNWQVDLRGWDMHYNTSYYDLNLPTKISMTGRFRYKFRGTFKIIKDSKCNCAAKDGRITLGRVFKIEPKYQPEWVFDIKSLECWNCDQVGKRVGKPLRVRVSDCNVNFHWGFFYPKAKVRYRLTERGCKILPDSCGETSTQHLIGRDFHQQVAVPHMPLEDGYYKVYPDVSQNYGKASAGGVWIQYSYQLKRLNCDSP